MSDHAALRTSADAEPMPFPQDRPEGCPFDLPAAYNRLRAEAPVSKVRLWDGKEAWFVTGYADVRTVLSDARFSNDMMHPDYPNETAGLREHRGDRRMLVSMDPPEHTALRRILARNFVVRQLELLRPNVQASVDDLIDDMAKTGPPADLVTSFALPVPAFAVSSFLGVPREDRHTFTDLVDRITTTAVTADEARAANEAFAAYIDRLLILKDAEPAEDVISKLLEEHKVNGTLTRDDVLANVRLILFAAFESTANQIAMGILLLLLHDDQRALLAQRPELINNAVEEILRYATIDQLGRRRLAAADVELGGRLIRAGDPVVVSQAAANRDPSVFPDGHRFDITRDARAHLSFSYGPHQCLGQAVARIELQVAIGTILERMPGLRLGLPVEEIRFKSDRLLYGVHGLPVTWDTDRVLPRREPERVE